MTITEEQYLKAKNIVETYEAEAQAQKGQTLLLIEQELKEYFKNNKVGYGITIKEFEIGDRFSLPVIIPIDPPMEENYEGQNDDDIEAIGEKHGIKKLGFIYWCYHK